MNAVEFCKKHSGDFETKKDLADACMKATGAKSSAVYEAIKKIGTSGSKVVAKAKGIGDFKKAFDVSHKIKSAIESIPEGGYVTELELREMADVDTTKFSRHKDAFSDNYITVRDKGRHITYWAKKSMITEMRKVVEK